MHLKPSRGFVNHAYLFAARQIVQPIKVNNIAIGRFYSQFQFLPKVQCTSVCMGVCVYEREFKCLHALVRLCCIRAVL